MERLNLVGLVFQRLLCIAMGYHVGGVWPHDNAVIASGMARYGLASQANVMIDDLTWWTAALKAARER